MARIVGKLLADHLRRAVGHRGALVGSCVPNRRARFISAQSRAVEHHHELTVAHQARPNVPAGNEIPKRAHRCPCARDHALPAMAFGIVGERLQRNRLGRDDELTAEKRDTLDPIPVRGYGQLAARTRRRIVEQLVRDKNVEKRRAAKKAQRLASIRAGKRLDTHYLGPRDTSISGLPVGSRLPPSGASVTVTSVVERASAGSNTITAPRASGRKVGDAVTLAAPRASRSKLGDAITRVAPVTAVQHS